MDVGQPFTVNLLFCLSNSNWKFHFDVYINCYYETERKRKLLVETKTIQRERSKTNSAEMMILNYCIYRVIKLDAAITNSP